MLRRWRGLLARRGKFLQVPPPPPVSRGIIEQAGARPRWAALCRRGRFQPNPAGSAAPVAPQRPGRAVRRLPSPRRGDRFDPPWPQVVAQPSVWPPAAVVARRRAPALPRIHGRRFDPPWPFVPPPPVSVGALTATDTPTGGLTLAEARATLTATDTSGRLSTGDTSTGTLQSSEQAGGPR